MICWRVEPELTAPLMTPELIVRRLADTGDADHMMVPGLCRGDLRLLEEKYGISVERGPKDLKDLPQFFGRGGKEPDLSRHDVKIFAEIVDAPELSVEAIMARAEHYRKDATLFITQDEGQRLMLLKLDGFIHDLRKIYPKFDTFPEDAQVALMDMIYNLGWKVKRVFVNFTKSINDPKGPDWKRAAAQSRRPQLSDARNAEVKRLLLGAARVAEFEARNKVGRPAVRQPLQ